MLHLRISQPIFRYIKGPLNVFEGAFLVPYQNEKKESRMKLHGTMNIENQQLFIGGVSCQTLVNTLSNTTLCL